MRIVVGSDHAGFALKGPIVRALAEWGYEVEDVGGYTAAEVDFPDIAQRLCGAILAGRAERGVMVCGTGIGACMAANKVPGIRAALCHDVHSAHQCVEHDHANVCCLGAQIVGEWLARDLLKAYLDAKPSSEEHFLRRLAKLTEMERHLKEPTASPYIQGSQEESKQEGTEVMLRALERFTDLLHSRFRLEVPTTEDSVRYTFFAALCDVGVSPDRIILEYPHPSIPAARIDTVILSDQRQPHTAIEFKYDRAIPSGKPLNVTARAGAVFRDLVRLLQWRESLDRYLIYLTDSEPGARSSLSSIFDLKMGQRLVLTDQTFTGYAPTFHAHMKEWPMPAVLKALIGKPLPHGHHLRVYAIEPSVGTPTK
jgi:ribose 5-phosphate isomerase B